MIVLHRIIGSASLFLSILKRALTRHRPNGGCSGRSCSTLEDASYDAKTPIAKYPLQVSKMKVTITCRFTFDGIEMDNEADCRFFFMLEKRAGRWGVCFYTLLFDKVTSLFLPTPPTKIGFNEKYDLIGPGFRTKWCLSCLTRRSPFPKTRRGNIPRESPMSSRFANKAQHTDYCFSGYRYLAWCESKISQPPKMDLNSHGPERDILYAKCKDWLEGKKVQPNLTGNDVVEN